jgi:transposase
MSKRKYTHVQSLLPEIKAMVEAGKTQREIAEHYGFSDKSVVKRLLERERRKELQGIPKQRGRKPAKTLAEYKYENKRLKMENELLRDFLQSTERK